MFVHYRTSGLILAKKDRGEADQLFTIYTRDFGKLEILGRAIRKISSKLRSGAELFYLSEIEFIQGKTQKTLTDAISIEKFDGIRKDLNRLKIAYKISGVLDSLVRGQEPDEKIWQLLHETFERLDKLKIACPIGSPQAFLRGKLEIIYYYFFWNLLSNLGYEPQLYNCSLCQKKILPEKLYFSKKEGGVICPDCYKKTKKEVREKEMKEIEINTIKILRILLRRDWLILKKLKVDSNPQKSLKEISDIYI